MGASVKDLIVSILVDDSKAEKGMDGLEKLAKNAAGAVSAAFAGAKIGEAFTNGLDLEKSNSKLAASLGMTEAESQRSGQIAGALWADNFGESSEQVTSAVGAVISSIDGMRTASNGAVEDITGKLLNLSEVFEVDVARSAQIAGQMVSTGMATTASQAVDLLTATLQKVPVNLREDLLDAVDEYSPFFDDLGLSGSRAMSMLAASAQKGMYGIDKTGDALKEFTIRSTDMSSSSVTAYEAMGLNAQEMADSILAGGDRAAGAFQTIVSGLLGVQDPATRANTAIALFGTPIEDLAVTDIPKFLQSLQDTQTGMADTGGAASRLGDTLNDNAASKADAARRNLDGFYQSLVMLPGPLGDTVAIAGQLGPEFITAGGALISAGASLAPMLRALPIFTAATGAATAAQAANNLAWLASPVTWIILAIIAAIALLVGAGIWLVQNWDGVMKWFGEAWAWLLGVFTGFAGWWDDMWHKAVLVFQLVFGGLVGFVKDGVVNPILSGVEMMVNGVIFLINGMIDGLNSVVGWTGIHIEHFGYVSIPKLATGGIVTSPTLALVGEAGPEAVVPLSQAGRYGLGGGDELVVHNVTYLDGRVVYESYEKHKRGRR